MGMNKQLPPEFFLSTREIDVALLIVDGLKNREIADKLGIKIKTVEAHRKYIFTKLRCRNAIGLALLVFKKKINLKRT